MTMPFFGLGMNSVNNRKSWRIKEEKHKWKVFLTLYYADCVWIDLGSWVSSWKEVHS